MRKGKKREGVRGADLLGLVLARRCLKGVGEGVACREPGSRIWSLQTEAIRNKNKIKSELTTEPKDQGVAVEKCVVRKGGWKSKRSQVIM